jgi:hypothetical protein
MQLDVCWLLAEDCRLQLQVSAHVLLLLLLAVKDAELLLQQ